VTVTVAAQARVADGMVTCPKTHSPDYGLGTVRAFFADDHLHMLLIVANDGRLITTIERHDLAAITSNSLPVTKLGTLIGRTVRPTDPLGAATAMLLRQGRRRVAVTDEFGRLHGLLCLKKDRTSYCTDAGIRERAEHERLHRDQIDDYSTGR
jgi:CBS domain